MKWRGGGFDNLRKHGKEIGQGPRRSRRAAAFKLTPEQMQICAHPGCGLTRYRHEIVGVLVPDHTFLPPPPETDSKS